MGVLNKFRKQEHRLSFQEEIVEHLNDLLNTKKNFGVYPLDYGIDNYVYVGTGKKVITQIMADIKFCLEKYEKRVREIKIQTTPNQNRFLLSFLVFCDVENSPHTFRLSFHHQKNFFNVESENAIQS